MSKGVKQQQRFVTISVRDLELNQVEDKPPLTDISCYLTVFTEDKESKNKSNKFFDLLILTDPHNSAKFKLMKGENQQLKVQLKTLSQQKLIGSVTINLSIFGDSSSLQIDQWINLTMIESGDVSPHAQRTPKSQSENNARIKMRFVISEADNNKKVEEDGLKTPNLDTDRANLNTTLQPCVNFPIKDEKKGKYDFTPILNREELEQTQQSIANIESRLVLTPERMRVMENSAIFQNKFQELIEKLMETKNQSLILGVTRQLNESNRRDLEKNNLTEILKRLNESQNYMEDDLLENPEQDLNNINLSLSGFHQHQMSKKQASPEPTKRNKCDLEGEIATLRLELEKKHEIEQVAKELKMQLFNSERNNESLLNQYNKAVDNYQKYFSELNEENLELKKRIVIFEKEAEQKDRQFQELKEQFDEKLKLEKLKIQTELIQKNSNSSTEVVLEKENELKELSPDQINSKIQEIMIKNKQEISHYSQMLVEAQNESVQLEAKMQEMAKEIETLQQKLKNQPSQPSDCSSNNGLNQNSMNDIQALDKSNNMPTTPVHKLKLSEDDQAYFEKLIKDKSLKISQLETEKAQIEFANSKYESKIASLSEKISELENQIKNTSSTKQEDMNLVQEENAKLKTQIEESEQLRSTLEDHLLKTKQNFQKKLEEIQQKQQQVNNETKINQTKDESQSMKKLVEELNQKSTFINELTYQNKDFKVKIQTLQEKIKILEFNSNEVEQLKKVVQDLETEKEKINSDLYAVTEDLLKKTTECISQQQVITQLSTEVKRLEKMIEDLLLRNPSQQLNYNPKKGDEIDEKLCEFLSTNVTPIKFVRIEEGLYNFGTKRIIVKLLKGKLVCRVGGGFMVIEEFLQLYTLQELIKMKQTGDYSLLNYPISEEKIDQLIQQDIQFNQLQYKQLQEQSNNNAPQQIPQYANVSPSYANNNNSYPHNTLRNSSNFMNQQGGAQQSQTTLSSENYFQNYTKGNQVQANAGLSISPQNIKPLDIESTTSFDNVPHSYDDCAKENQPCRSSIEQRQTPQRGDSYTKHSSFTSSLQQNTQLQQHQTSHSAAHTPVYHNRSTRVNSSNQPPQFLQSSEERVQQMTQHEKNQEMLKYLREQAQNDVHLRNELESLQTTIQMAANIKGSDIMRKYSQTSQNTFTNQQFHTFENNSNNQASCSTNQNSNQKIQQQPQYPIDFTNSNYNYHMQQNLRGSINNNNSRLSNPSCNSSSKPPSTYSIRATPQKHSQVIDSLSANTSAINEFTPQHLVGSKAATPKRNDLAQSAYQERILKQYSHKRNPAENFSPYSHNRHSSITSTFSAQKKPYYIHK